jgi:Na+-driven multidrug efflux pump
MSLILPSNSFLITLNKERKILLMQAVSIILAVILNYLFIIKGYGITGIAIATAVSYFFYSLFILISSFKHYTNGFFNYVKLFFKLYIPIFYVAFLLLAFNFFPLTGFFIKDFLYVLVKSFLFLIFNIPLIWIVNKRTGVVETFFKMALSKSKKLYK